MQKEKKIRLIFSTCLCFVGLDYGIQLEEGDILGGFVRLSSREEGGTYLREVCRGGRERMVSLVSRQGRQLQRYTSTGSRVVVGCIPYKFKIDRPCGNDIDQAMEVLVISSQKGHGMMFPKGGWEHDETIKQAVSREALEEAGVLGNVEDGLGKWRYESRSHDAVHEGIMFPLSVTEELVNWPEMDVRKRRWVTVEEARDGCQHPWMKEALERLVSRLSNSTRQKTTMA